MNRTPDAKLEVVLFDFDGTLVDTMDLIYRSMLHAVTDVLGEERPREELMANVGQPLPVQMAAFDEDHVDELLESYRKFNDDAHEKYIKSYPDVPESLLRLKDAGMKLGVVTSKRRHSVDLALTSFPDLRKSLDAWVTMEDTEKHKPNAEPLLKGLEMLGGSSPDNAAYVGDATFDVKAAKAANMTSVAVSWGAATPDTLRSSDPDYLVSNISEAVDALLEEAEARQKV